MATIFNGNRELNNQPTVGVLVIVGEIISNEQRDEMLIYLNKALKRIDKEKFNKVESLFNNLILNENFPLDSHYRRITATDSGSLAGILYWTNICAVLSVLKVYFSSCCHVSVIFCGQQIALDGSCLLTDSALSSDHLLNLFEDGSTYVIADLHIVLPFVSPNWTRLLKQKYLTQVHIDDVLKEINENAMFGKQFYERFVEIINRNEQNFDIYTKLVPRHSSGTIAFEEPNLYVLYGQQGEASLFGIRGFVVLINGGFSRLPTYWNLIRGLQTIDACILTHFDYDVLPGLQTILRRKTIPSSTDQHLCKPDIGAVFLNYIQRTRIQSSVPVKSYSNSKLLVNLSQSIDEFLHDIKTLNIETFDLVRNVAHKKHTIEPINLYKKIAFGSLDLYVLHPSSSIADDEKTISSLQRIAIRDQHLSSSIVPLHHWYSSCTLLVWTPLSKSKTDRLVRILYTGACPQTLVFDALSRARHLEFLHESHQEQSKQTLRLHTSRTISSSSSNSVHLKFSSSESKPVSAVSTNERKGFYPTNATKSKYQPDVKPVSKKSQLIPKEIKSDNKTLTSAIRESHSSTIKNTKIQSPPNRSEHLNESRRTDDNQQLPNSQRNNQQQSGIKKGQRSIENHVAEVTHDYYLRPSPKPFLNVENNTEQSPGYTAPIPQEETITCLTPDNHIASSIMSEALDVQHSSIDKARFIEITQHKIATTAKNQMVSNNEMNPKGLPIDDKNHMKKVTHRESTTSTYSINHKVSQSKQSLSTSSIFYVDVAHIPYHGNEHYVDSEFFRRIRARYYVLNAVEINHRTLQSLIDGKRRWEKQEHLPVTLVPTYDGDQLRQYFVMNKVHLAELNINIIPASTQCNVQYDDEGSPAQRLRFSDEQ